MKCPFCSHPESKVVDSRPDKDGSSIRRRRECETCGRRFTSHERIEEILPMVLKKDGRREPFDRMKLIVGIKKACEKRPVAVKTLELIADRAFLGRLAIGSGAQIVIVPEDSDAGKRFFRESNGVGALLRFLPER